VETIKRLTRLAYGWLVVGQSVRRLSLRPIGCTPALWHERRRCSCGLQHVVLYACYMSLSLFNYAAISTIYFATFVVFVPEMIFVIYSFRSRWTKLTLRYSPARRPNTTVKAEIRFLSNRRRNRLYVGVFRTGGGGI